MFPLKEPDVRFKIQVVAPTPERALELQWAMEANLKFCGETPSDDADKLLTTGWLATAEEAFQMFKEITDYQQSKIGNPASNDKV
jgi:hypothetical protein